MKSFFSRHKIFLTAALVTLIILPGASFAAPTITNGNMNTSLASSGSSGCKTPTDFPGLFTYALCLLSGFVVPFLIGLGMLLFLVGVVNYVRAGDNEEKRAAGKDMMWFGIVALFVMIGVWGFVNILFKSFFGTDTQFASLPKEATSVFQQ